MSEGKPNQFARVAAVLALVAAFLFTVVLIASSGGGSDDNGDDNGDTAQEAGPTAKGQRALEDGVWVVGEGDTLVSIAEETGLELDELIALNPDIDPQVLTTGQRISLRAGTVGEGADNTKTETDGGSSDTGVDAGDTPAGGGVGDEGPTGTSTTDSLDTN